METALSYILVFQIACGISALLIAQRKGRNRPAWLAAGTFLPVIGLALILVLKPLKARKQAARGKQRNKARMRPPKRCCGSYIPDCEGCPYFVRVLFEEEVIEGKKGDCRFYGRELTVETDTRRNRVVIEEEKKN